MKTVRTIFIFLLSIAFVTSCDDDNEAGPSAQPKNPLEADEVSIDRFSESAGTLMVRNPSNELPAANQAINFDQAPFITVGLGPNGEQVEYYNFDVQPTTPAPIYVLFPQGSTTPVADQLNIIDAIPGDEEYNDFWIVNRVTVPSDYVANTVTSFQDIQQTGYPIEETDIIVNCPMVPKGSTATKRLNGTNQLTMGWYKDQVVYYFTFEEKSLMAVNGAVGISPIYVTFNINPEQTGGGPASGFVVEPGTEQTHNVVATLPADPNYSPLWSVVIYDNADFDAVMDLASATAANSLGNGPSVNCPVVKIN